MQSSASKIKVSEYRSGRRRHALNMIG